MPEHVTKLIKYAAETGKMGSSPMHVAQDHKSKKKALRVSGQLAHPGVSSCGAGAGAEWGRTVGGGVVFGAGPKAFHLLILSLACCCSPLRISRYAAVWHRSCSQQPSAQTHNSDNNRHRALLIPNTLFVAAAQGGQHGPGGHEGDMAAVERPE